MAPRTPMKGWLRFMLFINVLNSLALIFAYLGTFIAPTKFVYFAFFGLSYPVWLLIALGFIVFWFFFRKRMVWVSLLTISVGFNHLRHFYTFNWSQEELDRPFKVLSYNVRIFNLYDRENRVENRNTIFDFLKSEEADIYCFQEFYHQENREFETKDSLIELLNTPHYQERYTHELTNERYFGVATFSKYPIIGKGEIAFDNDPNNFCIYSDIVKGQDTLRVFNAHIGSIRFQDDDYRFFDAEAPDDLYRNNEAGQRILQRLKTGFEKRTSQAEKVAAQIQDSPYPVIVCGDLNDTPVSYCYRQFNRLLSDAFVDAGNGVGTTYIGKIPSNRIDYIFYQYALKVADFQTHDLDCSDHRPISVNIGF